MAIVKPSQNIKLSSPLGDYIHLTSQGYLNHGTKQKNGTDYNSKIFANFQNTIMARNAQNAIFKKEAELKKAELQYNANRKANYETIKRLFENQNGKTEEFAKKFTRALLDASNLSNFDEEVAQKIISFENGEEDGVTARGLSLLRDSFSKEKSSRAAGTAGKNYTYLKTIMGDAHLGRLKQQIMLARQAAGIKKDPKTENLIATVEMEYKDLETFLNQIATSTESTQTSFGNIENGAQLSKELKEYDSKLKKYVRYNTNGNIEIAPELTKVIYEKMNDMQNRIKVSNAFNSLQAGFSEVMAALSSSTISELSENEIIKIIEKGVKGTEKANIRVAVSKVAKKTATKYSLKGDFFGLDITKNLASGKVDSILTLADEKVYASVKNYKLGVEEYWDSKLKQKVPSSISLVSGTPLSSLLLTAEAYQNKLGTHFLNILSDKEDGLQKIKSIRDSGIKALQVFLIYTALTGGHGDLKLKDAKGANLLIIEDKTSKKAYLFSTTSILAKAAKNIESNFKLTTGSKNGELLKNLVLNNTRVQAGNQAQNIKKRIEQILTQSHQVKLYASVNQSTIKNILNSRK